VASACSTCGTTNAEDARFCVQCGNPLTPSCPNCGTGTTPEARFCSACGHQLAPEEPDPTAEERRILSVLFCDLAGFTAHTEQTDPEDVRSRLAEYHTRVRQDVERFGGRIEKLMGDGVFAVFGAPTAHEDDPERAVRAALRIQESVADLNRTQPGWDLVVRVAVTTGEAIVHLSDRVDREGIIGDVVNTASRLEGIAEPGSVIVDERTYTGTHAAIEYTSLDPVVVKGKASPIPVWRAVGTSSRYGVAVEDIETPFIGRVDELRRLVDAFERVVNRGTPHLATITGEPGVGKSRLIREFRRAIDDRPEVVWWRQGRCLPYGEGVTFWAIGELVKAQAGILDSEAPDEAARKLQVAVSTLIEDADDAEWVASRLRPLIGMGTVGGAARPELFAAWVRFFESLAARNPLIMIVEDLHWADDAVLEFLDQLTEWATNSPILLVATARPELLTDHPQWGSGKRNAVAASLDPLTEQESADLMVALTERAVLPADLQRTLLDRSGGNPLYVTEYVRLAEEQGWFGRAAQGEELPLPDSIQAIIGSRIDLLSQEDRAMLQTAAVVGRVFWVGALAFAGTEGPDQVRESLRRLVRRELIRPIRRSSMQGQEEFTFAHVLVRDVAYGRLTRAERARHHESTARWLEAVSGERVADVAELLAHHLATSFDLAPSQDVDRKQRIYRFLMLSAERALAIDARRALEHAERAVAFASDDRERGRALLRQAETRVLPPDRDREVAVDAIATLGRAGDRIGEVEAVLTLANQEWYQGNGSEADRLDERALALATDLPPDRIVARAHIASAARLQLRGREEEALDILENGISVAQEVGATREYARGMVIRASALYQIGDIGPADAVRDLHEALRIQVDRGIAADAMSTYNNIATAEINNGDLLSGLATIDEAIAYANGRGMRIEVDWSEMTRCEALFPLGRWDDIEEVAGRMLGQERIRGTQVGGALTAFRARVRFFRGFIEETWATWRELSPGAFAVQDPQVVVPVLADGVLVALHAGHEVQARELAERFTGFASGHPAFLGISLLTVARPMIDLGMADEVEDLLGRADHDGQLPAVMLSGVRALLAETAGRPREAVDLWQPMIDYADRSAALFYGTWARVEAARATAIAGVDPGPMLEPARRGAEQMGARLMLRWLDEIETPGRVSGS
jgi:class 3 adenylate cyclase/tetratricopeptide (TPR) repeat protein